MSLFGPKDPCPRCGKKVRKPDDPNDYLCPHCHKPGPWATRDQIRAWEQEEADRLKQEAGREDARAKFRGAVDGIARGDRDALDVAGSLAPATGLGPEELERVGIAAFSRFAERALQDDIISKEEDDYLQAIVAKLGLRWERIDAKLSTVLDRVVIAQANAGFLPVLDAPGIVLKTGEVAHWKSPATLLKEVTLRELRAGYQGFSFPVGKTGVRYRIGGARGHSVVVGTQIQVADEGALWVTSKRAVFIGQRKTFEFAYTKLIGLNVFTDGIQIHVSNRQNAPLFRVPNGEVLAALLNGAANHAVSG